MRSLQKSQTIELSGIGMLCVPELDVIEVALLRKSSLFHHWISSLPSSVSMKVAVCIV